MSQFDYDSLKSTQLPPSWPKGLLTFIFILFVLSGAAAFGLNYYNGIQQKNLKALNAQFQTLREAFPLSQEQEIAVFEKKLNNLSKLLNSHVYFSNVLSFLEKTTNPQVYYTNLDFSLDKNSLVLEGIAKNQQILSEAVNDFVNDSKDVQTVILRDMKTNNDSTVQFHLELILQPQVIKYQSSL
ncbi:MAG: PilN domain-containing protein [Minisyncoccia bacterium]